jgi:hypothetical protein
MNPQRWRVRHGIVGLLCMAGVALSGAAIQDPVAECKEPSPPGSRSIERIWDDPWVVLRRGNSVLPTAGLANAFGQMTGGPIDIRLDDGRVGSLRVESQPCSPSDDCEPFDCGCTSEDESFWIEIVDAGGRRVSRMHLWAAYRKFEIVPVDLVDGPGDELIIFRIPNHGSPPVGYDVKVWKIGASKPLILSDPGRVASLMPSRQIGCALWRTVLSIDLAAPKPRPLELRPEFGSAGCCGIQGGVEKFTRRRIVRFDRKSNQYVFPFQYPEDR